MRLLFVELILEGDNKRVNYSFVNKLEDNEYDKIKVESISNLSNLIKDSTYDYIILIKNNMIPVKSDIIEIIYDCMDKNYDIVWFNKIRDDCRYFHKINNYLREAKTPNSCQTVLISQKACRKISKIDYTSEKEFISILNSLVTSNLKTAVTSNNLFYYDMNSVSSISDINKIIECDTDKNKEINYRSLVCSLMILFIALVFIIIGLRFFMFNTNVTK